MCSSFYFPMRIRHEDKRFYGETIGLLVTVRFLVTLVFWSFMISFIVVVVATFIL